MEKCVIITSVATCVVYESISRKYIHGHLRNNNAVPYNRQNPQTEEVLTCIRRGLKGVGWYPSVWVNKKGRWMVPKCLTEEKVYIPVWLRTSQRDHLPNSPTALLTRRNLSARSFVVHRPFVSLSVRKKTVREETHCQRWTFGSDAGTWTGACA